MRMLVKQIGRLFALSWAYALQYRGDIAIWALTSATTPLVSLAIWYSVSKSGYLPASTRDVITYYILIFLVAYFTRSWRGIFIIEMILNGGIIKYLLRPPVFLLEFISGNLVTKALQLAIPLPIFLIAIAVNPLWFSPELYNWGNLALFAVSLTMAYILAFAVDLSIGLLAFWIEDAMELQSYRFLLQEVASGVLIPFAFMPSAIRTAFSFLPFRYTISAPVEILLGQVQGRETLYLLVIQAAWTISMVVVMRILWVYGLRRYAIPGQ